MFEVRPIVVEFCVLWLAGGCGVEGEDDGWDLGTGAGFYVDASQEPWKSNYRMYSYVTREVSRRA